MARTSRRVRAMETEIVEVQLPNGAIALMRAKRLDGDGAIKTAFGGSFDFADVAATLEGLADAIKAALAKAAPDDVTIELALELAVKSGRLTGLVVEGEGKGSLAVTLRWGAA
jgi:hypothetical protein